MCHVEVCITLQKGFPEDCTLDKLQSFFEEFGKVMLTGVCVCVCVCVHWPLAVLVGGTYSDEEKRS